MFSSNFRAQCFECISLVEYIPRTNRAAKKSQASFGSLIIGRNTGFITLQQRSHYINVARSQDFQRRSVTFEVQNLKIAPTPWKMTLLFLSEEKKSCSVHGNYQKQWKPVSVLIPSTLIFLCKYIPSEKKPGLLGQMADSGSRAGNDRYELGTSFHARRQENYQKLLALCQKKCRSKLEGIPTGQMRGNLNNDFNELKHIKCTQKKRKKRKPMSS